MNNTSTITTKGQITIPANIRHMLGLNAGDTMEFSFKNKTLILTPRINDTTAIFGMIKSEHTASLSDIENAIKKEASK